MLILEFIIWFALLLHFVQCETHKVSLIDPRYPQFSKYDYNRSKMFGTMSPYLIEEECKPMRTWLMTRHGLKHPGLDILKGINEELVPNIQDTLKAIYLDTSNPENPLRYNDELVHNQRKIIRAIIDWKNHLASGTHKDINDYGKFQMAHFGKRLRIKLEPMSKSLTKDEIEVISSAEWRCTISAKKFLKEFFAHGDYDDVYVMADPSDKRIELAKPSNDEVKITHPLTKQKVYVEDYFFEKNIEEYLVPDIQKILFPNFIPEYMNYRLLITPDIVKLMYSACTNTWYYEDYNGKQADAWCWLFTFKDLEKFEQSQDLQYFNKNGYFLKKNTKLGNPITEDLLNFLRNPGSLRFKMFIGHASNCFSLITRFNLFNDNIQFDVDNILKFNDRKWKTSFIAPVGCNFMAIVYDCGYETIRVTIFLNERPIVMDLNNGVNCVKCPLNDVIILIESFNTSEVVEPEEKSDKDLTKKEEKKKKLEDERKRKKEEEDKKYQDMLEQRLKEVFKDEEDYSHLL